SCRRNCITVCRQCRRHSAREQLVAVRQHRFDETPVIDAIVGLAGFMSGPTKEVQRQPCALKDSRAQPTGILPLIWRVIEVTILVIRPGYDVFFINGLLEVSEQFLWGGSFKADSHVLESLS